MKKVIDALQAGGLELDATSFMDAIWLAIQVPSFKDPLLLPESLTENKILTSAVVTQTKNKLSTQITTTEKEKGLSNTSRGDEKGYLAKPSHDTNVEGISVSPIRMPAGSTLPGALNIVRALRALKLRSPSRTVYELNEQSTAELTAENMGRLSLVFKPKLEHPFEAVLVVEHSPSMEIWASTIIEIERMFEYAGIFRDRTTLWLHLKPSPVLISQQGISRSVESLCNPTAKKIIFFFTHGVSEDWCRGILGKQLSTWGRTNAVVILHALPAKMWKQTSLGEPIAMARSSLPGCTNHELKVERAWWDKMRRLVGERYPIPTFCLEPNSALRWVEMFMAKRHQTAPTFLVQTKL